MAAHTDSKVVFSLQVHFGFLILLKIWKEKMNKKALRKGVNIWESVLRLPLLPDWVSNFPLFHVFSFEVVHHTDNTP